MGPLSIHRLQFLRDCLTVMHTDQPITERRLLKHENLNKHPAALQMILYLNGNFHS